MESQNFHLGEKVFAKIRGYPPWPARVDGVDKTRNKVKYRVFFYGTEQTGVCKQEELFNYIENRKRYGKPSRNKGFNEALAQIDSELGIKHNLRTNLLPKTPKKSKFKTNTSIMPSIKKEKLPINSESIDCPLPDLCLPGTSQMSVDPFVAPRLVKNIKCEKVTDNQELDKVKEETTGTYDMSSNSSEDRKPVGLGGNSETTSDMNLKRFFEIGILNEIPKITKFQMEEIFRIQKERKEYLFSETAFIQLDYNIRTCLGMRRPDTDTCIQHLNTLLEIQFTPLMLKKHPEGLDTIKKLRKYSPIPWKLTKEQAEELMVKAAKIREKAEELFTKIKPLFMVPVGKSFWEIFAMELKEFHKATRNMKFEDISALTIDPSGIQNTEDRACQTDISVNSSETLCNKLLNSSVKKQNLVDVNGANFPVNAMCTDSGILTLNDDHTGNQMETPENSFAG